MQTKVGVVTWCSRDELGDGRLSLTSRLGFFTAARPRPGSLPLNSPQTVFPSALPPSSHVAKLVIATWQSRLQTKESSKEQRPGQRRLCFYRTHVHMGSNHWVLMSKTHTPFVETPCWSLIEYLVEEVVKDLVEDLVDVTD